MEFMSSIGPWLATSFADYFKIIVADIVLSGDNALIIGMAAAGLAPELRQKAIIFGMVVAAVLRVSVIATKLLGIPAFCWSALLLFWVCWKLFNDRDQRKKAAHTMEVAGLRRDVQVRRAGRCFRPFTITLADVYVY